VRELRPLGANRNIRNFDVAPIELLLALGKATAVPSVALASLRVSSIWAVLRYLWAFEPPGAGDRLRLSRASEQVVRHQRALLSEQFGIAVAAWLYETEIAGGPVEIIDAEWATTTPFWRPVLSRQAGPWPDYLMFPRGRGARLTVVECKGNSGSPVEGRSKLSLQKV
jgi:hypothetical protein